VGALLSGFAYRALAEPEAKVLEVHSIVLTQTSVIK
jgi:hypothetical protein